MMIPRELMEILKLKHFGKLFKLSQVCKCVFTPNQSKSNQADWVPLSMTFASNMSWTTFTSQQSAFVPIMNLRNAVATRRNKLDFLVVAWLALQ